MKHYFLKKFSLAFLLMAMCGIMSARAEESVSLLFFSEACGGTGIADDGVQWTVTSDADESTYDQARGVHYGTGTKAVTYVKLSTADITGTITKIVVNASGKSSPSLSVKVGGAAFGTTYTELTNQNAAFTFTGSASGDIEVLLSKSKKTTGALYVRSVAVTCGTPEAVATHTVSWSVNGVITSTGEYAEGANIPFPNNPGSIDGKVFMGWSAAAIPVATDTKPTLITQATMGNSDVTYYAVFATVTEGTQTSATDVLTADLIGISNKGSYYNWSGKTTETSSAVYAGNSARSQNDGIQLRATSPSGIVTTTSGGKLKKVAVEWETVTTAGRTLEVYGLNKAYASSEDLYKSSASTKGQKLGEIVKGTSTELTIDGDYKYVGLRSANAAMFLASISITWDGIVADSYSDYCTLVGEPVFTDVKASIGSAGLATFSSTYALDFTNVSTIAAYTAAEQGGAIVFTRIYQVPANTGLLLRNALGEEAGAVGPVSIPVASDAEAVDNNALVAVGETIEALPSVDGNWHNYILNNHSVYGLGFFQANNQRVAAGKAYLRTYDSAPRFYIDFEGTTTAIPNGVGDCDPVETIYNLNGQRVKQPGKGCLYIVGGKKMMVR